RRAVLRFVGAQLDRLEHLVLLARVLHDALLDSDGDRRLEVELHGWMLAVLSIERGLECDGHDEGLVSLSEVEHLVDLQRVRRVRL
ncbi:hypothetical protein PMAYCL1PPCAC_11374, partial [Pristionchus mayeri]